MNVNLRIGSLPELANDQLALECWLTGSSPAKTAKQLLIAYLAQREQDREAALAKLANKRGISPNELRIRILKGDASTADPLDLSR